MNNILSIPVKVPEFHTLTDFQNHISVERLPAVLREYDVGTCVQKWSADYLKSVNPDKKVKVHKSVNARLDFRHKNFSYETIGFRELIEYCSSGGVVCETKKTKQTHIDHCEENLESGSCSKSENHYWYLRSLGDDPRGKDVADLSTHFPELYGDLKIPQVFDQDSFFSSVFRITSPKLQLWTHYDTCNNILIQVRGRKRVVFFPPSEALHLYLDGDKSEVLDVDNPDLSLFPDFAKIQRYEVFLEEGDVVFIPALWFHNITALEFSVSVNIFWKNLSLDLYDKKDTYGNRDLVPVQLGFRTLDKAVAQLNKLPKEYQDFYLRRMIISLQKKLEKVNCNSADE